MGSVAKDSLRRSAIMKVLCPVCLEETPRNKKLYHHYGGVCCNSCKLFFKRASKKTIGKCSKFSLGQCHLRGAFTCKKCRYERCLRNNMSKKFVQTIKKDLE